MNANGLRTLDDDEPIATDSRSFATKSGTTEGQIEYEKNNPVVSIYPQMTQIPAD